MIRRTTLVKLEGVSVEKAGRRLVSDLTFSLPAGEHVAVTGRNGAGKTTFISLLRGDLWPTSGRRLYNGRKGFVESPVSFRSVSAVVSPALAEFYATRGDRLSGLDVVASGLFDAPLPAARLEEERRAKALKAAARVSASDLLEARASALSQGQLKRLLLARALAANPRVLFLDEFDDGLDAAARAELLGLVAGLAKDRTWVVMATHRQENLIPEISLVVHMAGGRIASVEPRQRSKAAPKKPSRARPAQPSRKAGKIRATNGDAPLVLVEKATVAMDGREVLRNVNWRVERGEHWAVVGANGAGKSTLLRLVHGDLHPLYGGRVVRFGEEGPSDVWTLRGLVGHASFEAASRYPRSWRALEVVCSGFFGHLGLYAKPSDEQYAQARELLDSLGLGDVADHALGSLSNGQVRRVLMARAMVHFPRLLLLDEPLGGLDAESRLEMLEAIEALAAQGAGLVVVTHHEDDLPACVNRVAEVADGEIVYAGELTEWRARRANP